MTGTRRFQVKIGNNTFLVQEDELLQWCAESRVNRDTLIAEEQFQGYGNFSPLHKYADGQSDVRWKKYARPRRSYKVVAMAITLGGIAGLAVLLINPPRLLDEHWRAQAALRVANLEKEVSDVTAALGRTEVALATTEKQVSQEKEQARMTAAQFQNQLNETNTGNEKKITELIATYDNKISDLATAYRKDRQNLMVVLWTVRDKLVSALGSAMELNLQESYKRMRLIQDQVRQLEVLKAESDLASIARSAADKEASGVFRVRSTEERAKSAEFARKTEAAAQQRERYCRSKLASLLAEDMSRTLLVNVDVKEHLLPLQSAIEQAGTTLELDFAKSKPSR